MKEYKISHDVLWALYVVKRLSVGKIAEKIGCASTTVTRLIHHYNIPFRWKKNNWTPEEVSILKNNYEKFGAEGCMSILPRHPKQSIGAKAKKLGLHHGYYFDLKKISLSDVEKGYFAGMVDGEGCVSIYLQKNRGVQTPLVAVSNSNLDALKYLRKILKVGYISRMGKYYRFDVKGISAVLPVLEAIRDALIIKRRNAELVLEFCRSRISKNRHSYSSEELALIKNCKSDRGNKRAVVVAEK